MLPSTLAKRLWLLLFLAVIAFYLYGLGSLPLVGPDEPRYAQVAREMFLRGDLITPTLGGYTWFEKPVLLYWMMILSYRLFGAAEWSIRLAPALSGLATIAAVYWWGRRIENVSSDPGLRGLGQWSALITATTMGIIVFSRGASFDIVVTMPLTWALVLFFAWQASLAEKQNQLLLAGFYIFAGLALLAKGLIGLVIPLGVIGAFYLMRREFPQRRFVLSLCWGLPLALGVAAIWYGPVIARHGWPFIDEFFLQHHFARYLSDKYRHPQPFYFYVVVLAPLTLPWTAFLIDGLIKTKQWSWRAQDPESRARVFALAWLLVPLIFFSFSGSKLPGYILPVLPAAALIAGERLTRFVAGEPTGPRAMQITGAILIAFAFGALGYAQQTGNAPLSCALVVSLLLFGVGLFAILKTDRRLLVVVLVICATLAANAITLNCGVGRLGNRESVRDLLKLAETRGFVSTPVFFLHRIDRTAEFYAAFRLLYRTDGEPVKFESVKEVEMAAREDQDREVLVLTPLEHIGQLTGETSLEVEVLGDNGRFAIVVVRIPNSAM